MTLNSKKGTYFKLKIVSVCSLFAFFFIWYMITDVFKLMPTTMLPSPVTALETGIDKWTSKRPDGSTLPSHILASLKVSVMGFCFGSIVGVPLGIIMAWWEPMDDALKPFFDFIRNIPAIAWIPIMIVLLGIGVVAKASIVFFSAFIPNVINSYTGIKNTKQVHIGSIPNSV